MLQFNTIDFNSNKHYTATHINFTSRNLMHRYIFLLSTFTITSLHSMHNHPSYLHTQPMKDSTLRKPRFPKDVTLSRNVHKETCVCCQQIHNKNLKTEDDFKKCLERNIHSIGFGSSMIPILCKKEAKKCMMMAGRARVADILADFQAAKNL